MTIGSVVAVIRAAGGAKPGSGLVLGGDDEAVPEENFGGDGRVEEGEVRLLDAGGIEQFFEGADGGAVEVKNFVERGLAIDDSSEARDSARRRLRQLAGPVRVEHGTGVEGVEGGKCFGFAVVRCCSGLGSLGNGGYH